jgi:hypothetical protein
MKLELRAIEFDEHGNAPVELVYEGCHQDVERGTVLTFDVRIKTFPAGDHFNYEFSALENLGKIHNTTVEGCMLEAGRLLARVAQTLGKSQTKISIPFKLEGEEPAGGPK